MLREIGGITYQSKLDHGPILGAYLGLFGLGLSFVAIGIFTSALTSNQVVAFVLGCLACFLLYEGFSFLSEIELFQRASSSVASLGIAAHFDTISNGLIDTRDILYFFSVVAIFLLLTRLVLTIKRG